MNRVVFLAGRNARKGGVADYLVRLSAQISKQTAGRVQTKICFSLEEIGPLSSGDVVSLQYVPHGFQSKGLPFDLPRGLGKLLGGTPTHIMFHEIWTGDDAHDRIQNRALRPAMQVIARGLVRRLRPLAIHTSNQFYQGRLASVGIRAEILPILNNIPIADPNLKPEPAGSHWRFVTFGGFDPRWDGAAWMSGLCSELAALSSTAAFIALGRQGDAILKLKAACEGRSELLSYEQLGELPAREISLQLSAAHAGMVSTPAHFLGRSGAYAAMVGHGLPVFATNPGLQRNAVKAPELLVGTNAGSLLEHAAKRFEQRDLLPGFALLS